VTRRRLVPFFAVAGLGCNHAPPTRRMAEQPVSALADIAGRWISTDDLADFRLTIGADGSITTVIFDRARATSCKQAGRAGRTPTGSYHVVWSTDGCYGIPARGGPSEIDVKVTSFTGARLVLVVTGDGVVEHHVYTRAPEPSATQ